MLLHLSVSHSVHGGCLPHPQGRHPPPSACMDTHPCPVHAGIHTPYPVHAGIHIPPAQCMLGYGQQAGGMHPT